MFSASLNGRNPAHARACAVASRYNENGMVTL